MLPSIEKGIILCSIEELEFFGKHIQEEEFKDKKVLEVGSRDVNGSCRPLIESMGSSEYIGLDFIAGKSVDIVYPAEKMMDKFFPESFDVVVCWMTMEHTEDWRTVIMNIKTVLKPQGLLILGTCRIGFPLHSYPDDHWRYEKEDFEKIFKDFKIILIENFIGHFPHDLCIFLKARKPENWKPTSLDEINLYSMKEGKR